MKIGLIDVVGVLPNQTPAVNPLRLGFDEFGNRCLERDSQTVEVYPSIPAYVLYADWV